MSKQKYMQPVIYGLPQSYNMLLVWCNAFSHVCGSPYDVSPDVAKKLFK